MHLPRFLTLVALLLPAYAALAQDEPDLTGTWNWTVEINAQTMERSLVLEVNEGEITGRVIGPPGTETPIEDALYEDGRLSFTLHREFNGQRFTLHYDGEVGEDSIVGQTRGNFGGQEQRWDWEAVRAAD